MEPNIRACVAFVVASVATGKTGSGIYDISRSKFITISGNVVNGSANVYDHDRGCSFGGTLPSLYDHGTNASIDLRVKGSGFEGYDHGAKCNFNGTVNG